MIDQISKTSLMLEILFNEIRLATATGFVIKHNGLYYLATNKHVVTGCNPDTGKLVSKELAIPNILVINHHVVGGGWVARKIFLYRGDNDPNHDKKKWLEHPDSHVDVVLVPIEHDSELVFNELPLMLANVDIIPVPAMPISIVGFPFGRTASEKWPIWVTGFIASEPDIDIDGKPLFYVSAPGREALSGSPVFLRLLNGTFQTKFHNMIFNGAYVTKFMGIYSGRLVRPAAQVDNQDDSCKCKCHETDACKFKYHEFCPCQSVLDVCRVWKPVVFEQIFAANKVM